MLPDPMHYLFHSIHHDGQVRKAVESLLKFVGEQRDGAKSKQLFDEDDFLNICFALKKMPMQV